MPYDPQLADKVRSQLSVHKQSREQLMMGGIVFLLRGNLCCGVDRNDLIVRVGPDRYEEALCRPHVRPMDITGRALKGFVLVGPQGYSPAGALRRWVQRGVDFALALPPKAKKAPRRKRARKQG